MSKIVNKIIYIPVFLVLTILFFLIIFNKSGLKDWWSLKREEQKIQMENMALKKENAVLVKKLYRLKHDPKYIEYVARHEFGMAAPDELIFRFKKSKKGKNNYEKKSSYH